MKKRNYTSRFVLYSIILVLMFFNGISSVLAQEYDPNTFNSEKIAFSSLGNLSPSNIIDETLIGNETRIVSLNLTFDIPENLYHLRNNFSLEYGVELTFNPLEISINTSVFISVEWNNEELIWSTTAEMTNSTAKTYPSYSLTTLYEEEIAKQKQNQLKINFAIYRYETPLSTVKLTIDQNNSYIVVNRVRGVSDIPSTILTLLFGSIFVFFIIGLPIWIYGTFRFGWRSPVPYLTKIESTSNNFFKIITNHSPDKVKKCPSCKFQMTHVSRYCPDCGLNLNQGIIGVFRLLPFNLFIKAFPYVFGFLILPLALFLPNMSFPIVSVLMVLSIFLAGQTLAIAKPTFEDAKSEILIWKKQENFFKRLISLILLVASIIFYLTVFIPTFFISFILFLVAIFLITRFSSNIETSETKILLKKYQKELSKIENNLEAWDKGGKLKKAYLTALGRSKGRMAKKQDEKALHVEKKKEQKKVLEKDFIATQKKAFDWRRTYVYANYGVTWFSGSLLAFTLSYQYYKFAQSFSLPTFGLPLSRLGFIDEAPFFILHIILFFGIMIYCFLKDPLKPGITLMPFQKFRFEIDEGRLSTKVRFICMVCNMEVGQDKLKQFFNLRKSKDTLIDHAGKYLTPCDECGLWVGSECVLMGACLNCNPFCSSCGAKLMGNNQSICQECQQEFQLKELSHFCRKCGQKINQNENYCYHCGMLFDWK